jgi:hypothetical protein
MLFSQIQNVHRVSFSDCQDHDRTDGPRSS